MEKPDELIEALRSWAALLKLDQGDEALIQDLERAADMIEKMDERIDIMRESMDAGWGKDY